jgi:hypothetical protein
LFQQASGVDPDNMFDQLLDADKRTLSALRDLKSSPRAVVLRGVDDGVMASRTGIFAPLK